MRSASKEIFDKPAYTIAEASRYLGTPKATIRNWLVGGYYPTKRGERRRSAPVIRPADSDAHLLSFTNLIEVHLLEAIRREHGVSLQRVRRAVEFLKKKLRSPHPLIERSLATDGLDLFVEHYGALLNVSQEGQAAFREILKAHLRRIERNTDGIPVRLYPFTRQRSDRDPKTVVIDPRIQFGRPVLVGTGIPTAVIAERYKAGESVADLAEDYGRNPTEIEEAIRCELPLSEAA